MPISSIILKVSKENIEPVTQKLKKTPNVFIHKAVNDQLIVTTDTKTIDEDKELVKNLISLNGVLSGNVVFTNIEDCS